MQDDDGRKSVPADFPREPLRGSVTGAQPKLLGRMVDGKFIVGLTDTELDDRYGICEDLVQQLSVYCACKQRENPDWSREFALERTAKGIEQKCRTGEWDFSTAERDWMMTKIRAMVDW
jgi:hypothetical protein